MIVTIKKEFSNTYALIDIDAMQKASNELKNDAFKLWMYLAKNKDGESWKMSQKACENWGIKKDAYYRGLEQLKDKGYLVEQGDQEFEFCENPMPRMFSINDF